MKSILSVIALSEREAAGRSSLPPQRARFLLRGPRIVERPLRDRRLGY
jgi:hypothetical protein